MNTVKKFGEGLKQLSVQEMASQLRQPSGEIAKEVGKQMNQGNEHICKNAYDLCDLQNGESVLEIGMGNGFFVKEFLKDKPLSKYFGADFSPKMVSESVENNLDLVKSRQVEFIEASIEKLPFSDSSFDKIVTVNTLYFWPNPEENAKELLRILKPNGTLLIGYRHKSLMDKIPFTQHGFTTYTETDVEQLLNEAGFTDISTSQISEPELDFGGTLFSMTGYYTKTKK